MWFFLKKQVKKYIVDKLYDVDQLQLLYQAKVKFRNSRLNFSDFFIHDTTKGGSLDLFTKWRW